MAWIISRALLEDLESLRCSQELGEESSRVKLMGGGQYVPSNTTPTPQAFLSPDKMRVFCRPSLSGMTFAPLMENHGEELLMLYRAGFPVKMYRQVVKVRGLQEPEAGYGKKCSESFARLSHGLFLQKIHPCSQPEEWAPFLGTWPNWGIMQDGVCWALETPTPLIDGTACGSLPTPVASDSKPGGPGVHYRGLGWMGKHGVAHTDYVELGHDSSIVLTAKGQTSLFFKTLKARFKGAVTGLAQSKVNPQWVDSVMGWPVGWSDIISSPNIRQWETSFVHDNRKWEWLGRVCPVAKSNERTSSRLKCLGNGQVPKTAAMAWKLLTKKDV
jgi:hypothetical protein